MENLSRRFDASKKWLITALFATFLWGLGAHGYAFFDNNVSHDSLREFHAEILGNDIKLTSGRIFTPIYRELVGNDVTMPWLGGLLALLWIGLAVFLVVRILKVESKPTVVLIAGIFATNISVSSTAATYIHDLDSYMFAMLCAVAAVWLWNRYPKGWLVGVLPIMVSLGIYQSYVFTAVALVMIVSILELMNGVDYRRVFQNGIKAVGMLLLGAIAYLLVMRVVIRLTGTVMHRGEYNSLDRMTLLNRNTIGVMIVGAYTDWLCRLWNAYSSYPAILIKGATALFFAIDIAALAVFLLSKKRNIREKLLCVVLTALLPLGMNMIYVLTLNAAHDLMVYPICLFYLLTLLLAEWLYRWCKDNPHRFIAAAGKWQKAICVLLVGVCLYGNVRFSNGMYMKKNLEFDANLSLMTRIVGRMEAFEGYEPGQTPVVFVGLPKIFNQVIPGFKDYWNVTGMTGSSTIYTTEPSRIQAYFDYILSIPLLLADGDTSYALASLEEVQNMPCYPAEGFMRYFGETLVVKLGDIPD